MYSRSKCHRDKHKFFHLPWWTHKWWSSGSVLEVWITSHVVCHLLHSNDMSSEQTMSPVAYNSVTENYRLHWACILWSAIYLPISIIHGLIRHSMFVATYATNSWDKLQILHYSNNYPKLEIIHHSFNKCVDGKNTKYLLSAVSNCAISPLLHLKLFGHLQSSHTSQVGSAPCLVPVWIYNMFIHKLYRP